MAVADERAVDYCGTCEAWCAVQYSTLHTLLYNRRCIQQFLKLWQLIPHFATHIHPLKFAVDGQTREGIGIRQVVVLVGYWLILLLLCGTQ